LGIRPGQRFQIEKRMVGRKAEWFVSHLPDLQPRPGSPQRATALLEASPALDAPHGLDEGKGRPAPVGAQTALEHALKTAVSAAAEAEKHGQSLGYNVRFTP